MDAAVEFLEVSYFYPKADKPALRDVSLRVAPGEIVGLAGPTGAGKTTLALACLGIVPQFYGGRFFGAVRIGGLDTTESPVHALARRVGLVFQDPETQLVAASVEAEVAFALENLALPAEEIRARVGEALAATGLEGLRERAPHALSGGQQQRLAFACALALRPGVVVLDEPTSQLDPESTAEVFRLMARMRAERGTAFIVTGHAAEEMAATCDRIVLLSGGRVVADGPPRAVYGDVEACARERVRPPEVAAVFHELAKQGHTFGRVPVTLAEGEAGLRELARPRLASVDSRAVEAPARGRAILSLCHVSHVYPGGFEALRDVSLDVFRGDYTLLIGENGAGKSTLLKHLLGLLRPTRGQVMLDGVPLATLPAKEIAGRIGYVPQNPDRQLFNPTVEAEVGFSLRVRPGLSEADKARRVDAALEELGLTALRKAHPFALSKGDRARVVVAAVLVLEPEVLVFDEPTTGQDAAGARAILDLTRRLHAAGRTVVVVTHHLYLMPGYARRAVVLGGGRVLRDGGLREVYHDFEALAASSLRPTQATALARAADPAHRAVTAEELAASYAAAGAGAGAAGVATDATGTADAKGGGES